MSSYESEPGRAASRGREVEVLSSTEEVLFPDEWYELAQEEHFWMQWRFRAFLRQLGDLGLARDTALRALEVGCGIGTLRRQIEGATEWTVDGAELMRHALEASVAERGRNLLYDINDCRPELKASYDCVVLFDVLEHVEDSSRFLDSCLYHLRPGGWIFLNVPALRLLWSHYDVAAGHVRRYDRPSLRAELGAHPLEIVDLRYWGLSMVPLLALRKLLVSVRKTGPAGDVVRDGFRPPGAAAHAILKAAMRTETRLLSQPPVGTSLLAAARRV